MQKFTQQKNRIRNRGVILTSTLVFAIISVSLIIALTSWFAVVLKSSRTLIAREQAFHLAEAGIEYYRWHLAHAPTDFMDGTGIDPDGVAPNGPYIHDVEDIQGEVIGQFSIEITEPATGTTLVVVESTGIIAEMPEFTRTIRVQFAKPSFAKYSFLANDNMRFGEGTEVFGPIHSNQGIRFDGLIHNLISSALPDYNDPDHGGSNEFSVHTHVSPTDPLPPNAVPDRFDVFEAGREFSVPAVDFSGLTNDLADLKTKGQEPEGYYFADSGRLGYRIVLKTDDTFDLYQVRSFEKVPHNSCKDLLNQDGWGTWSVNNDNFLGNYDFPENGVIFLEDDVWVEGQIDTARLTIAAGQFPDIPSNYRSITVNNDLIYTNKDGQDVLSLIAQGNFNVGLFSEDDLQIDAALVAQNGRIGRYYYTAPYDNKPGCSPYDSRDTLDLYGMIATNLRYGFAYTGGTGYANRNITYDANLLFGPPPEFPLTSDQYEPISWGEVIN